MRAAPSHASSASASAETAEAASDPTSSSNRYTTSPDGRCAQPPTILPSHQTVGPMLPVLSNNVGPCGPRYQSRACQPIGVGSSAGSSDAVGAAASSGSSSSASTRPG